MTHKLNCVEVWCKHQKGGGWPQYPSPYPPHRSCLVTLYPRETGSRRQTHLRWISFRCRILGLYVPHPITPFQSVWKLKCTFPPAFARVRFLTWTSLSNQYTILPLPRPPEGSLCPIEPAAKDEGNRSNTGPSTQGN